VTDPQRSADHRLKTAVVTIHNRYLKCPELNGSNGSNSVVYLILIRYSRSQLSKLKSTHMLPQKFSFQNLMFLPQAVTIFYGLWQSELTLTVIRCVNVMWRGCVSRPVFILILLVRKFSLNEGVVLLPQPPLSPDIATSDFCLFQSKKIHRGTQNVSTNVCSESNRNTTFRLPKFTNVVLLIKYYV
jgi:hypothetical protein